VIAIDGQLSLDLVQDGGLLFQSLRMQSDSLSHSLTVTRSRGLTGLQLPETSRDCLSSDEASHHLQVSFCFECIVSNISLSADLRSKCAGLAGSGRWGGTVMIQAVHSKVS
jgi:hypothetical protein